MTRTNRNERHCCVTFMTSWTAWEVWYLWGPFRHKSERIFDRAFAPLPFFPFCLPLPLITCLLSPFPFFRSGQFAEICPNFWHLKHFSFDKSTSHALVPCLRLPHVPHFTPPTASKFKFPSPSLADMSWCAVESSDTSTWLTWNKFFLGWNSANAHCCCSQRKAVARNAWYQ